MKKSTLTLFILLTTCSFVFGQAPTPDIKYSFEAGLAQDDNSAYMATLLNGAKIMDVAGNKVLSLGSTNGYLDLGANIGTVIGSLTNFTMSTDIFIDLTTNLATNGNFVWTFSNSTNSGTDKNGYFNSLQTRNKLLTAICLRILKGREQVRFRNNYDLALVPMR